MSSGDRNKYPPDWDKKRVQDVIEHYEGQSVDEAVEEIETAAAIGHATVEVPHELLPAVRDLIVKHSRVS